MALKPGLTLNTVQDRKITILKKLNQFGAQADIYEVSCNNQNMILKLFRPSGLTDPQGYYTKVKAMIRDGPPNKNILYPIDLLPCDGKTFGYVMEKAADGYHTLFDYLHNSCTLDSHYAAATAAINLAGLLEQLELRFLCYPDLNPGNIFIHPRTGGVQLIDTDPIIHTGEEPVVKPGPEYAHPLVVLGRALPCIFTTRHCLAVVLFLLLFHTHPLQRTVRDVPPFEMDTYVYGTHPMFIMDSGSNTDLPDGCLKIWNAVPEFLHSAFRQAFSQDALKDPRYCLTPVQWKKILLRYRAGILHCPYCGQEALDADPEQRGCSLCGQPLPSNYALLQLSGGNGLIRAAPDVSIHFAQLGTANADRREMLTIIDYPGKSRLYAQNVSNEHLRVVFPSGKSNFVVHGQAVPLIPGTTIQVRSRTIKVINEP